MDLVLIHMTPSPRAPHLSLSPEIAADMLWTAALPDDRLEHIRARHGLTAGGLDIGLFLRAGNVDATETALRLCCRAIKNTPVLSGWCATALCPPLSTSSPQSPAHSITELGTPHDVEIEDA